jgi:hypothetical protein
MFLPAFSHFMSPGMTVVMPFSGIIRGCERFRQTGHTPERPRAAVDSFLVLPWIGFLRLGLLSSSLACARGRSFSLDSGES